MAYPQTIKRSSPTLAMALLGMTLLFAGLLALVVFLLLRPGVYGHEQITIYNQVPCCCAQARQCPLPAQLPLGAPPPDASPAPSLQTAPRAETVPAAQAPAPPPHEPAERTTRTHRAPPTRTSWLDQLPPWHDSPGLVPGSVEPLPERVTLVAEPAAMPLYAIAVLALLGLAERLRRRK